MKRNFAGLAVALVLLAIAAIWTFWSSRAAQERRDATLATVPEFPHPGQAPTHKPAPGVPMRPRPPQPKPAQAAKKPADPLSAFVLAKSPSAGVVSVNALLNTPLFEQIKACLPEDFDEMRRKFGDVGIDLERDVDRIGVVQGGTAISGFFDGKPVAEKMMDPADNHYEHGGANVFESGGACAAQFGNLVLLGKRGGCDALIDRAQTPPAEDASQEIYGDVWFRSDLTKQRGQVDDPRLKALLDAMNGVTLRANVWDSVALSVEGTPATAHDARDLAQMARGAISLVKGQFDDEDVELKALADLAQVSSGDGKLQVNLAIPSKELFERLHFPCPGRADAGTR